MEEPSAQAVFVNDEKEIVMDPQAGKCIEQKFLPAHIAQAQSAKVKAFLGGDQTNQTRTKKADPAAGKGVDARTLFHHIDAETQNKGSDKNGCPFGFHRQHKDDDGVDIGVDEAEEFHFIEHDHLSDPYPQDL